MASFGLRDLIEAVTKSDDAFGNRIVQNTINEADIAGHYPYSPERWRVFVNDDRQLLQYNSVPEYTDATDVHRLMPQASGDVVKMRTTERYRYVVGYVLEWSGALETNQPLQSGDAVAFGYGDADFENSTDDTPGPNADGWFFYWTSDHAAGEVTIAQYRAGVAQDEKVVQAEKALDTFARYEGRTNWYSVGRTRFAQTYTYRGTQTNEDLGRTSKDNGRSALIGNHPLMASVKAGDGAGSLEIQLGSVGLKTLGGVSPITRQKTHTWSADVSTTGTWVPIHAMRVDPDRQLVNLQLTNTDIVSYSGSGNVQITAQLFDPSNVLDADGNELADADFSAPGSQSPTNSVLEVSDAVDQVPDDTGTVATSVTNPGGYQVGYGSWYESGSGSKTAVSSGSATRKREVDSNDIAVLLAKTTDGGTIAGESITEQDW